MVQGINVNSDAMQARLPPINLVTYSTVLWAIMRYPQYLTYADTNNSNEIEREEGINENTNGSTR